jgi:hypothetical protein
MAGRLLPIDRFVSFSSQNFWLALLFGPIPGVLFPDRLGVSRQRLRQQRDQSSDFQRTPPPPDSFPSFGLVD